MAVSVSNIYLMERVRHLTVKIYSEMLCITRHDGMKYIRLNSDYRDDDDDVSVFCRTPQYRIVLSWDSLDWISVGKERVSNTPSIGGRLCSWGRILSSFTNFITSPDLSGPFYISQGIYHAQITEYYLEKCYR